MAADRDGKLHITPVQLVQLSEAFASLCEAIRNGKITVDGAIDGLRRLAGLPALPRPAPAPKKTGS